MPRTTQLSSLVAHLASILQDNQQHIDYLQGLLEKLKGDSEDYYALLSEFRMVIEQMEKYQNQTKPQARAQRHTEVRGEANSGPGGESFCSGTY